MTRIIPRSELPPSLPEPPSMSVGTRLGRYELLCPIAEGGMAHVWAAEQTGDLGFRKVVALKTIRPDYAHDPSFRAMFLDEAQLASRIRHVNVVEVLDLGVEGDVVYQAMALVDGIAVNEWQRHTGGRFDPAVATRIAIDMLRGLHAAHTLTDDDGELLGLVHRDVSPQNVLIGSDGLAKLADFGIAKAFGRATEETVAGDVKGKLGYVAPEQLVGLPATPQSDLFAAGVVFWELLTGERLFHVKGNHADERRMLPTRDPRTLVPDLPAAICEILMRSLADDPFARFETASAMADALEDAARRLGLDTSSRAVGATLERDVGRTLAALRDRLRKAKKRGLVISTPISMSMPESPPIESPATRTTPISTIVPIVELPSGMTDTVTVGEPVYTPTPAEGRRRGLASAAVPLGISAILMAMLLSTSMLRGAPRRAHAAAPAVPIPSTAVVTITTTAPTVARSAAPPEEATAASAAPVEAKIVHRPPLPRGRARVAAAPSTKPRFENPY